MLDNLRAMAVFASVVKHGSFSGAAKELNITTSAVSQQIRSLEGELGVVLLQRSTRKVSLTEVGELFYGSAVKMVAAAEVGWHQVSSLRDEVLGSLTIAVTTSAVAGQLMAVLTDWLAENQLLSLRFMIQDENFDFNHDQVDMFVGLFEMTEQGQTAHQELPLGNISQVLLSSPKYLENAPILNMNDLAEREFITLGEEKALSFVNQSQINPKTRLSTNDINTALGLAVAGHGVIKINVLDAKPFMSSGELVRILENDELPSLSLTAKLPNKEFQPVKVQRCLEILKGYFKEKAQEMTESPPPPYLLPKGQ